MHSVNSVVLPHSLVDAANATVVNNFTDWVRAGKPSRVFATAYEPAERRALYERLSAAGVAFASIIPKGNWIADDVIFSEGVLVLSPCMIMPTSVLGRCAIIMPEAAIGHDVSLGDFVTVGAAACISGYVSVGDGAVVGAGAVVVNGTAAKPLRIGNGAHIRDGATVTKEVPDHAIVAGNPGRRVRIWRFSRKRPAVLPPAPDLMLLAPKQGRCGRHEVDRPMHGGMALFEASP
jgi:acetyltransferase-like isoleucine patch superfamily enzyme